MGIFLELRLFVMGVIELGGLVQMLSFGHKVVLCLLRDILSLQFVDASTPEVKSRNVLVTNPTLLLLSGQHYPLF